LFPVGAFAYSDGLESATASGEVATAGELRAWIDVCLDETLGRMEGPAVWQAWPAFRAADWDTLVTLDQELTALRPSSSARRSSHAMGRRLLSTWQALYPDARIEHALTLVAQFGPALPIAFAGACACSGIDRRRAVEAFAYTRLAATLSAAMRLMPIGQTGAHALLARTLERVPAAVELVASRDARIESFAPAADIAAMTQQYVHSRLFRS
jgi:urease accessory protein